MFVDFETHSENTFNLSEPFNDFLKLIDHTLLHMRCRTLLNFSSCHSLQQSHKTVFLKISQLTASSTDRFCFSPSCASIYHSHQHLFPQPQNVGFPHFQSLKSLWLCSVSPYLHHFTRLYEHIFKSAAQHCHSPDPFRICMHQRLKHFIKTFALMFSC